MVFYFLSEVVRCGALQKKSPRDSTKRTARGLLLFSDVPQIAAYHKNYSTGMFLFTFLEPTNA